MRLLERRVVLSSSFFECVRWSLGSLDSFINKMMQEALSFVSNSKSDDELEVIDELKLCSLYPNRLGVALEEFVQAFPQHEDAVRSVLREECRAFHARKVNRPKCYSMAQKHLSDLFGLDQDCAALCEFLFIKGAHDPVESYFENDLQMLRFGGGDLLAHILDIPSSRCREILRELSYLGIVDMDRHRVILEDPINDFWTETDSKRISEAFCRALEGEVLPLGNFTVPADQVAHAQALLRQPGTKPLHILLYGPPGTGKTTFARSLAASSDVLAWTVSPPQNKDNDRRAQLTAGVRIVSRHEQAFLLVDEAERILDCNMFANHKTVDKAWLNTFMEKPGQRVVWITNHVHHLEGAVRRRFHFSIHFEPLGRRERGALWRQILERHGVLKRLDDIEIDHLARDHDVPASIVEMAVTQASALVGRKRSAFLPTLKRVVDSYESLRRNGAKRRKKISVAPHYDPKGVSLEGSVDTLVSKLTRADNMLRNGEELGASACTMLFYGPPGTGKTALARYLADQLDRECKVVRASDLLGSYLGETEQNIAKAFREAEKDEAVLVIDEADSFLFPREMAQRSWEATQVNEFLTALEECRGFCICTTNRRENMDQAVMRRFSHKIAFTYSKPEQVKALYDVLLAPMVKEPLPVNLEGELLAMLRLTPGDFHAIRAQMLNTEEDLDHADLVCALRKEQGLKLEGSARGLGFL